MVWTLTTSGAVLAKTGLGVNSDISSSGAALTNLSNHAEGRIVALTRRNWVSKYSDLDTDIQNVLNDTASSIIAQPVINWDTSGYDSLEEAQTLMDLNKNIEDVNIKALSDFKSNSIQTP